MSLRPTLPPPQTHTGNTFELKYGFLGKDNVNMLEAMSCYVVKFFYVSCYNKCYEKTGALSTGGVNPDKYRESITNAALTASQDGIIEKFTHEFANYYRSYKKDESISPRSIMRSIAMMVFPDEYRRDVTEASCLMCAKRLFKQAIGDLVCEIKAKYINAIAAHVAATKEKLKSELIIVTADSIIAERTRILQSLDAREHGSSLTPSVSLAVETMSRDDIASLKEKITSLARKCAESQQYVDDLKEINSQLREQNESLMNQLEAMKQASLAAMPQVTPQAVATPQVAAPQATMMQTPLVPTPVSYVAPQPQVDVMQELSDKMDAIDSWDD